MADAIADAPSALMISECDVYIFKLATRSSPESQDVYF